MIDDAATSRRAEPRHQVRVQATPWPGVHATWIDSARHYGRHFHATHGIGRIEQGAQRSASGRGVVEASVGDLIATNPGEVHDGQPLGGRSRRWRMLYLEPGVIADVTGLPQGENLALAQPVFQDRRVAHALEQVFARLDDADTLACDEALAALCGRLAHGHLNLAAPPQADADVRRVRERLADEHLMSPPLGELAALVGLSRYQLLRRFEKAYGVPPHAWLLQQRAERARALIRNGLALAEAAAQAGFADQSHMTRIFMRHFGFTPGAWRQALQ